MNPERGLDLGSGIPVHYCVIAAEMTWRRSQPTHGREEGERGENQGNDPNEERGERLDLWKEEISFC